MVDEMIAQFQQAGVCGEDCATGRFDIDTLCWAYAQSTGVPCPAPEDFGAGDRSLNYTLEEFDAMSRSFDQIAGNPTMAGGSGSVTVPVLVGPGEGEMTVTTGGGGGEIPYSGGAPFDPEPGGYAGTGSPQTLPGPVPMAGTGGGSMSVVFVLLIVVAAVVLLRK